MGLMKMGLMLGFLGFMLLDGLVLCMAKGNTYLYDLVVRPTIEAYRGDTIYVNVHNQGTYGVTIHWHGVKQPRNPWSDGPENVTQCPIQPGRNFTYEVILSDEEGTLWWHAHSDWTRATVHGAIIIKPAQGTTYPFPAPDAEETIVLASWFKGDVMAILGQVALGAGNPGTSNAYTINGQPGDLYPCSMENTTRIRVDSGKTYLFRIINAVMNEDQFFGISGHKITVVGQDAAYIKPFTTDYIMITPGQTMDVLVRADQTPSQYYIASTPFSDLGPFDNTTTTAILQYRGNYTTPSTIPSPTLPAFNDSAASARFVAQLRSLVTKDHPINVPRRINQHVYVTVSLNFLPCPPNQICLPNGFRLSASMNNVSFQFPRIDVLDAYYSNINGVFDRDFPSRPPNFFNFTDQNMTGVSMVTATGTKAKLLNYGDAVEVVFQGTNFVGAINHPLHIHGYSFYLVGTGTGNFNNVTDPRSFNLVDPPHINTVAVPKNGWAAVRFYATNPGNFH
ncbi:hypothetical protein Tsubulata_018907, partial [Turnera subulata]